MHKKTITYKSSGVNYGVLDPVKKLAQTKAAQTAEGFPEISASRGESAYVWEEKDGYRAFVIEGLGTKNLVADAMRAITGKTYYDALAQDTVAMIINDLIVVGAVPQVVSAYFAVGDSGWFKDEKRATDLVEGWAAACRLSGAAWGGGETPTLKDIVHKETIELAGSAVGVIAPKERLTLGEKFAEGDRIILVESNGIHANGLTLARAVAGTLPDGYATRLPSGIMYGEALLKPTLIYASLVQELFAAGVLPRYMVNITGHGWRKLMRATREFSYIIELVPDPQEEFAFIQSAAGSTDEEMYASFNMGAGFAIFVAETDVPKVLNAATSQKLRAYDAGYVREGRRSLEIMPKHITFEGKSLNVR